MAQRDRGRRPWCPVDVAWRWRRIDRAGQGDNSLEAERWRREAVRRRFDGGMLNPGSGRHPSGDRARRAASTRQRPRRDLVGLIAAEPARTRPVSPLSTMPAAGYKRRRGSRSPDGRRDRLARRRRRRRGAVSRQGGGEGGAVDRLGGGGGAARSASQEEEEATRPTG